METPSIFTKDSEVKDLTIIDPQEDDPKITFRKETYYIGEMLEANCTTSPAKPPPHITWLINDEKVRDSLTKSFSNGLIHGHGYFETRAPSIKQLSIEVSQLHAGDDGRLRLTCMATIPGYVNNESDYADIRNATVETLKRKRFGMKEQTTLKTYSKDETLVANSLDAKSTSIAIRINLLTFKIQVADNGEGITEENMHFLGLRHTTNKCRKYKDLEHLKTYGYRGEALASIVEMCEKMTVTSRCEESNDTYFKELSKALKGKVSLGKHRSSIGTTVTVLGWFSTVPVRRQRIIEEIELEEVKKNLEALIIINPQASFSLRNDVTGLLILSIPKTSDIVDTFRHLHPELSDAFTLLKVSKSKVTVRLLIQKELFSTKKFQYIYVNKRPVKCSKIKQHIYKTSSNNPKNKQSLLFGNKKHPVYVMNIKCPQKCLDLTSKELEMTCWDLVLTCIDKLIKRFFGFEEKDKPIVKANKEVKVNCGLSRIFGVVEATAYKRKSDEIVMEDTGKRMCLDMFKPIEDKEVADKTKSSATDELKSIGESPPKENLKSTKSATVSEEKFDQKSTYSKLNDDENLGKKLILDMFLKSTQVYPSEEDINASGETIQEANMLFENQIEDPIKGTNTTMSVSINVKKKRLKRKANGVQTRRKPSKRILKNPSVNNVDVTSKAVQTSLGLLFQSRQEMHELTDTFREFSLDNNDDYTVAIHQNNKEGEYMFLKKRVDDNSWVAPLKVVRGEYENYFNFKKPMMNEGNYLQGMQEEDNYERYKKPFKPPIMEGNYLPFQDKQFEITEGNCERFKKPQPRPDHLINSETEEGSCLPFRGRQEQDDNEQFVHPLRTKPILNGRAEEGDYFSYRGILLHQEKENYEKFTKASEHPIRCKPIINSRVGEGSYLPFHGMHFQHDEDNRFRKPFEPPLIRNSRTEEGSFLPFHGMQPQREDNNEKCNKPFELPLRPKPIIFNSMAKEGSYCPFQGMELQQQKDIYGKFKNPSDPSIRYEPIVNSRTEELSSLPFHGMQFQQEQDNNKFKKPFQPPLRSKPILNSRTGEGSHLPFHDMQQQQEDDKHEKFKAPPIFNSRTNEGNCHFRGMQLEQEEENYDTFKRPSEPPIRYKPIINDRADGMQFQDEEDNNEKFRKRFEPPLMSKPIHNNRVEERSHLPYHGMQFQHEDDNNKFKKPFEPPWRSSNGRTEEGRYLPVQSMQFQQEEIDYENVEKPSEHPRISKPVVNEDNYNCFPFQGMQFQREDNHKEFEKPYDLPQISAPMVNWMIQQKENIYKKIKKPKGNEGNHWGIPKMLRFELQENNNYEKLEERFNEGNHLALQRMQQFARKESEYKHFKNPLKPSLRINPMVNNGDCVPSRGMTLAPEARGITNFEKPPEPPLISKQMALKDNYFQYAHKEDNNDKLKHFSETPLISKPMINKLPFQKMQQFQSVSETFQNPMEPSSRSNPLDRVNDDNYLAFPGMQEDVRFKKTTEPSLWVKPAVKKTRDNNYRPILGMHQFEQENVYENLKKPVEPLQRQRAVEQENITDNFRKPLEPAPRVNRNYLPHTAKYQFEQDKTNYEKFPDPAEALQKSKQIKIGRVKEGYYFPPKNMQFDQRKNTYEHFQNPQESPPMNRLQESDYLHFREMQQQNYIQHFKKSLKPLPINNFVQGIHLPFSCLQQDAPMANEYNCLPFQGMQFQQEENDYEKFKKHPEHPLVSKPRVNSWEKESDYLPFQGMRFEHDYEKFKKPSRPPLVSEPVSNRVNENNYLSFRGIKKLSIPRTNHISGPSPYFSKKNKGFKDSKSNNNCIKSPTNSTISNYFKENPQGNCYLTNNVQPETPENYQNIQVPYSNCPQRQCIAPQGKETVNPNSYYYPKENDNQIFEALPEIVPDDALEEPPWLTPNVSNDDFYMERSPEAKDHNETYNYSPNIFRTEAQPAQKEDFYEKSGSKKFDFNIFSNNEIQTQKELGSFCDLQDFGFTGSKNQASSNLEISIPNKDGQREIIRKDLCDLRGNNFELGSLESDLVVEETEKSLEKSRVIVNSQNEWLRHVNDNGEKFFYNKRTGMVSVQTPKLSQTKFDFDERLDFVPKGLSPALKGHKKVEKLLSQKAKNKLHDLILEGYEDELMVIKWQKFIGNSPKTFFENIYKEKTKQFDANIPSVHENALKIPKDFVNFDNKMFKSLRVLGQLDKKFIVVYETTKDLLILFDQHAVHERIRVERLTKEYKGIKTPYKGQLTIFLQYNDLSLLKNNVEYLESLGLGVNFMTNGLHVTDIPLCMQKDETNFEDLNKILNFLIKDTVEVLKVSRGSAGTMMPKILQNIISLRACRGAIKFGNSLTEVKCRSLLKELSKCMLPFQCAHGRPTLSPIVSLDKIDVRIQVRHPNLKKLLRN
ncbi:unnamed protein product [Ceutorhynchus assimilis]|uniref:Ig-like domain-containing protein n=1 Tax=Ceutorhynchus assimilis TaxID=467358 RepID=A0A9N9MK24_9CUCU|nr:unnamed protein product [Ceutorhynchus assimilis]